MEASEMLSLTVLAFEVPTSAVRLAVFSIICWSALLMNLRLLLVALVLFF